MLVIVKKRRHRAMEQNIDGRCIVVDECVQFGGRLHEYELDAFKI